jgi:hypothetical protein
VGGGKYPLSMFVLRSSYTFVCCQLFPMCARLLQLPHISRSQCVLEAVDGGHKLCGGSATEQDWNVLW